MTKASKLGYRTIVICTYVPFYILKDRVTKRANIEGRGVSFDELKNNMLQMLPAIFETIRFADEAYILDNMVPLGNTPVSIHTSITNWEAYDDTDCCNNDTDCCNTTFNIDQLKQLVISVTSAQYDTYNDVKECELTFLNSLILSATNNKTPRWSVGLEQKTSKT